MMKAEAPIGSTPHDLVKGEFKRNGPASVNRVAQLFDIHDPHGNISKLSTLAHTYPNVVPVIIGSHQSHADGIGYSEITKQFDGTIFKMPLSDSILLGKQGNEIAELFQYAYPGLTERGIEPVEVRTEGDVVRRNMEKKLNLTSMAKLSAAARQGKGVLVWPEGSIEGGRYAKSGRDDYYPKLQLPNPRMVKQGLLERWIQRGYEPIVLLCAVDGSWKIYDPDDDRIPDEAGRRFLQAGMPEPLARIWVGDLIDVEELRKFPNDYSFMNLITEIQYDDRSSLSS